MTTPAWSIGQGKRSTEIKPDYHSVPGPGTYEAKTIKHPNPATCRIGTSRRSVDDRTESPGPGAYDSPGRISRGAPKYGFGTKTESFLDKSEQVPGPGAYDVRNMKNSYEPRAPAYSIRARSANPQEHRSVSPGPAAYDQNATIVGKRGATYRMGSAKRDQIFADSEIPGPGAYVSNLTTAYGTKQGPKWGFGTAHRDELVGSKIVPGPGAYTLFSMFNRKGKGPSLVSRKPDNSLNVTSYVPGPGAYTISLVTKKRAPAYGVGHSERATLDKEQVSLPGPGNYDPKPVLKKGSVRIGSSRRRPLNEASDVPGPGHYSFRLETNDGPKYGIIPRREDVVQAQKDTRTPGPADYEPTVNYVKQALPNVKIGSATRDDLYQTESIPGPGNYDVRGRPEGPKWGFGRETRSRKETRSAEPGPGAYDIKPKFAALPKYALGSTTKASAL